MELLDRFLNYVKVYTTSDEENDSVVPSAEREFDLARILEKELKEMGASDVQLTEHCYVYALLPATAGKENVTPIGFISHMDTAPDFSGENVKPQIIENYDGGDVFLKGAGTTLKVSEFPDLKSLKGRTLITTDGTTLLGADDKAGVAEIMTLAEILLKDGGKEYPHGDIYICFTPDEEIGNGPDKFDLNIFKAKFAYTVDGDYEGEVAYENFNAASAAFKVKGVSVHPGEAKGIMKNASLIACEIANALPKDETPAMTEGREGFFHLTDIEGDVSEAKLLYIIRDHDEIRFEVRKDLLKTVEEKINEEHGEGTVTLSIKDSYKNMISVINEHEDIVELAEEAIKSVGLEPLSRPVRGGTDGARLSFMGLPCPNLGTGGYGFHGPYEHISLEGMKTAVEILKYISTHVK